MTESKRFGCLKLEYPLNDLGGVYKDIADTGFSMFVFDPSIKYHLCEATGSYALYPIGESFIPKYEGVFETHPKLVEQLYEALSECQSSDIEYMHAHTINNFPPTKVVYDDFEDLDEAIEFWRGTPPF